MTTILELIDTAPAAGDGLAFPYSYDSGAWRGCLQLADPLAGSSVVWHDATQFLLGYSGARGPGIYDGRFDSPIVNLELKGAGAQLAPWNSDTSPTFGTHVELGPGLLVRFSLFRVSGGVVVEWLPRFTHKVEYWGDAAHARGGIRRHLIVARGTQTSLVDVPVAAHDEEDWSDRVVNILADAGWQYGLLAYHDLDLLLPARDEQGSAATELDATLDPVGLVWYSDRYGHLVIRPRAGDTLHGAVLPQPTVHFSYLASDGTPGLIAYAVDSTVAEPVGICKSELAIKNRVVITSPTGLLDLDNALSIQRFDPKTYRASWLAANDPAADQLLGYRAFAQYEATPFVTTVRQPGFHDLLLGDWLYPAEIDYRASSAEPAVNATGVIRQLEESARFYGELAVDMAIRSTVDIGTASDVVFMLPVEDLAVDSLTDTTAVFSWSNPGGQPVDPTHTQFRLIGATTIWTTAPYPIIGLEWDGLTPGTAYQFQVRLVEITDGVLTTVSPVRVVSFTTTDLTTPGGGDGSGDVDVPDYSPCTTDWRLFQWDPVGDDWDQIASGNVSAPPVDVSSYLTAGVVFRLEARENCSGVTGPWVSGPAWIEPDDWGDPCLAPAAFADAPFDDPDLIAYVPQLCAPATIREAVSHNEAEKGPAFQVVTVGDDGRPRIWSTAEGRVLQGLGSADLGTLEDDATLVWRGKLGAQPAGTIVLASFAGLEILADADGSGFGIAGGAYEQTGGHTVIFGATELPLDTETFIQLAHNTTTDTLTLYVAGVEEVSAIGTVGVRDFYTEWYTDLPADSWLADVAVFGRVLAPSEMPGYVVPTIPVQFVQALGAGNSVVELPGATVLWLPGDYVVALAWNSNGPTLTVPTGWTRMDAGGATDSPALIARQLVDGLDWQAAFILSRAVVEHVLNVPASQTQNAQYTVLGIWRNVGAGGLTDLVGEQLDNSPANLNVGPIDVDTDGSGVLLVAANQSTAASFMFASVTDRLSTEPSAAKSLRVAEIAGPQTAYQFTHDGVNPTDLGVNNRAFAFALPPASAVAYAPAGAVSYVGAGTATTTGSGTTITPALPGSLAADDLLVCVCHNGNDGGGGFTTPAAGWQLVGTQNFAARDIKIFMKRAIGGGSDTAPTFTGGGTAPKQAQIHAYRGVAAVQTAGGSTLTNTHTPPRDTPVAGCWALAAAASDFYSPVAVTTANGYTFRGAVSVGSNGSAGLADKLISAAGPPSYPVFNNSGGGASAMSCFLIYLLPV